jgi:serine/threonine-protein kinase
MNLPLSPGTRLGQYEILAPLGSGGMGEVYRARDTKLQREVAVKVLPSAVSDDPDRLARFRREAQLLASLNHPHIGAIYGVEDTDRVALVLELVDGVTLGDRIAQGPLPWKEAVALAVQIADGLEAAHQRGIVHRDLKPANIKIANSGRVKVLDFGLAKAGPETAIEGSGSGETAAMTVAHELTREGMVVGTIGYMSPEQARGQSIDKRTDVWAFGCVVFEMLAGRAPFEGQTPTDTLAAIVERDPPWSAMPSAVPSSVTDVVRRCLAKDRARRFHDLADVRILLEEALAAPPTAVKSPSRQNMRWGRVAVGIVAAMAVASVTTGLIVRRQSVAAPQVAAPTARLIAIPDEPLAPITGSCAAGGCGDEAVLAISPDGRRLAYVSSASNQDRLFVRDLDRYDSRAIPGTEGARGPVFSPDGQRVAFIADRKLKIVALDGGASAVVREFVEGNGLSWGDDGYIYFNPGLATGLWRVPASGGTAEPVTKLAGEFQHRFPHVMPGGVALLYSAVVGPSATTDRIYVHSFKDGQSRALVPGMAPHYLPSGHLAYVDGGRVMAVRFDASRLEVKGTPTVMMDGVGQTLLGTPQIAFSASGTVIYAATTGESTRNELVWVDQQGTETPTHAGGKAYVQPRLSVDGRRVALALRGGVSDIWEYDLLRESSMRVTFDNHTSFPLWTPDGKRLTFVTGTDAPTTIFWKPTDGTEAETSLLDGDLGHVPLSWTPDSRTLAFVTVDPQTKQDIWTLNVDEKGKAHPFLQTEFREGAPAFSPDGRWLAYVSDESGQNELYVRPYPGPGQKWTISTEGASEPVWAKGSAQLFYRNGDAVMVVDVKLTPEFSASRPRLLFRRPYERSNAYWPNYDVTPDGRRLLMLKTVDASPPSQQIHVVLNWFDELKQRVP